MIDNLLEIILGLYAKRWDSCDWPPHCDDHITVKLPFTFLEMLILVNTTSMKFWQEFEELHKFKAE